MSSIQDKADSENNRTFSEPKAREVIQGLSKHDPYFLHRADNFNAGGGGERVYLVM